MLCENIVNISLEYICHEVLGIFKAQFKIHNIYICI